MNNIGARLIGIRSKLGYTQTKMASILGIAHSNLHRFESNSAKLTPEKIINLYKIDIDLLWLLTGEGKMFRDKDASLETKPQSTNMAKIPIIDVRASAGTGVLNYMEDIKNYIEIPLLMLPHNTGSKNLSIVEVYGDSMEPTLHNGEPVFIDTGAINIVSGEIYLIRAFGELRLKRLERKMNGNIIIFSDNPAFTSEELTLEQLEFSEIAIIGKMLASLRVYSGRLY